MTATPASTPRWLRTPRRPAFVASPPLWTVPATPASPVSPVRPGPLVGDWLRMFYITLTNQRVVIVMLSAEVGIGPTFFRS